MNLLFVDDSKAVHAMVRDMLPTTIKTNHVYDGQQALQWISQNTSIIDLVFLDWEMPVLTGIEALPLIKTKHPDTPVIMMTSKNAMGDIAKALELGALDYMIKPFTRDIILGKITQTLGKEV